MTIKRILRGVLVVMTLSIGLLAAYEAYALWRAESRTDDILAAALSKPQQISLAQLSAEQKDILLKVEDPGFYEHSGVDLSSPGQGMTTITQALVKLLYFDPFKPGFAKIEQSLIARFVLNRHLTKDQQLSLFINQAYFGNVGGRTLRGFADASATYFGKPFESLSRDEYIGLVGMLIGPNALQPEANSDAFNDRVHRIKALLDGKCAPVGLLDPLFRACAKV